MIVKVLHDSKSGSDNYKSTKIIECDFGENKKKFKLYYECSNGSAYMDVDIMTQDGTFKKVLDKYDIGVSHVSYVSSVTEKDKDSKRAFDLSIQVLKKIYND